MNNLVDECFSGVVSVWKGGGCLFRKAYGYADWANRIPNECDTKFGTASAGKVFVAAAVLKMIELGLVRFDSTIGEVLPLDWKNIDPTITIEQLLNHTSGIPDYFDESVLTDYEALWYDFPNYRIRCSKDLIPFFIHKPMMYAKGQRFQYNNTGYVVLGLVIEEITGMPFDMYLKKVIFDPCGMEDTGYFELDRLPAKCANSYIMDSKGYRTNIFSIDAKGSGAGGAFTTAFDVEYFWKGLWEGRLIKEELIERMISPQVAEQCYGYGVWLLEGGVPSFQGCDPGVNFISSFDRTTETCITIISNIDYDVEQLHNTIRKEI